MNRNKKIEVLNKASVLLSEMNEIDDSLLEIQNDEMEKKSDELYEAYWNLIHTTFSEEELRAVTDEIGVDQFIDQQFVDTLRKKLDEPRVLDEYEGYVLQLCWENESLFVFRDGEQYSEDIFYDNDETAIEQFRNAIDANPNDPQFYQ